MRMTNPRVAGSVGKCCLSSVIVLVLFLPIWWPVVMREDAEADSTVSCAGGSLCTCGWNGTAAVRTTSSVGLLVACQVHALLALAAAARVRSMSTCGSGCGHPFKASSSCSVLAGASWLCVLVCAGVCLQTLCLRCGRALCRRCVPCRVREGVVWLCVRQLALNEQLLDRRGLRLQWPVTFCCGCGSSG
jgi:hypothetical protein